MNTREFLATTVTAGAALPMTSTPAAARDKGVRVAEAALKLAAI